ncbi:MAG: dihydrofolate reductase [Herminiimonas sp.]|nr:dihydrofolate reductase [Herminiimonas sp.]
MKPNLTIIVAIDSANGIGIGNALPWHLPADLAHFKRTTSGHPIIMGRKTFDSIGRPLPTRRNIVISRNPGWTYVGAEATTSLQAAIDLVGDQPAFIIGGAQIFLEALPRVNRMIVTEIDRKFSCDVFFPPIDVATWQETAREQQPADESGLAYAFVTYDKIA